ncbi:MAG TPA: DUF2066 domain-containing protein [Nevskiaceae bacterium]|nr:DUF2066 domain-containing protein [Nevskiaceae bacterium]
MRVLLLFAAFPLIAAAQTPVVPPAAALPPTATVNPSNPYEALVPLADSTPAAQAVAMREALATVIAGITGLPDVRMNPSAVPILDQAQQLVQHYGDEQDATTHALMFRVAFDQRSIDDALKRAGLPIFGLVAGAEQDWPVEFRGVGNFRDYGHVVFGLRRMRGVKSVQVQAAENDRLQLVVRFEGDAQALTRTMASDPAFVAAASPDSSLHFTLKP